MMRLRAVDRMDWMCTRWTWAPDFPGIAFCGLQRAMGSVIPVAELQARWIAAVFSGARKLPMKSSMEPWMQKHQMMKSQSNKNRITYMDNSMGGMMEEIAAEVRKNQYAPCGPRSLRVPLLPALRTIKTPMRLNHFPVHESHTE